MSNDLRTDPIKPKLLALLREARVEMHVWIDALTEAERAATGSPSAWAPKDLLAHLTSWRRVAVARVIAVRHGEQPLGGEEVQRHNDATFARERMRPWPDVLADSDDAFEALLIQVEALTEPQLAETGYPWLDGFPFWASVAGTFEHTLEHLADYYREHGGWPHAEHLLDRQAAGLLALDGSDHMRAYVSYSQGGFWATAGRPDRAIPLLRDALTCDPQLVAEAQHDTRLDALRGLPEFQSLFPAHHAAGPHGWPA
jgi:hypothetical protein